MSDNNNRTSIVVTVIISVVGIIGIFYLLMKISGYNGMSAMYMRGCCCCCGGGGGSHGSGGHGGSTAESGDAIRSGRPTTIITAPGTVTDPIMVKIDPGASQEIYFNSVIPSGFLVSPRIQLTRVSSGGNDPVPPVLTIEGKSMLNNPSAEAAVYTIDVYYDGSARFMYLHSYMATSNDLDANYSKGGVGASVSIH